MEHPQLDSLNLENFNQAASTMPILNSPRSLEACRRQGIEPEELIIKTLEDMKIIFTDKLRDKKYLEAKLAFYEGRRKQKLQFAKDDRVVLKDMERQGLVFFDAQGNAKYAKNNGSNSKNSGGGSSSLIEREKKQLEKIQFRQKKEIEQMMEYEIKMQEISVSNEEKMKIDRQKEAQRQKELQDKHKKQEELRQQQDQERAARANEEAEKQRKKEIELEERQQQKMLQEEQAKKDHQAFMLKREEERKVKQEEFKKGLDEKLQHQQAEIEAKKKELDQKNEIRRQTMEEKHKTKAIEAERRRLSQEAKLKAAKDKNEEKLAQMMQDFLKKEDINEQKRKQFEEERRKQIEDRRVLAAKHHEEITEVLQKMREMEEQKKKQYLGKIQEAEDRKKQLELQEAEDSIKRKAEEAERQEKRGKVKDLNTQMLQDRTQSYLSKLTQKEQGVERGRDRRRDELLDRINAMNILHYDRRDTVRRIMKMQHYQRDQLLEKIEGKMSKATNVQEQKTQLLQQRAWMRQEIDKQKSGIVEKMEKIKLGKIDPKELIEDFKKNSTGSLFQPNQSMGNTFPKASSTQQSSKKRKIIDTQRHTDRQRGSISTTNAKDKPITIPNGASEKEIEKAIQEMKQKQNVDMLRLLEEEQDSEYRRERSLLEYTDPKEKAKMEKLLAAERSKGQAKIQRLADLHFEEVQKIRRQFQQS